MLLVNDYLNDQSVLRAPISRAPLVSVILPTYRRRASGLFERALVSVLNQSFDDFELLIMDDGSTDGSYDLIEEFRARDPRVIHVRHERNSGLPGLRVNEGIELARGQYLAFQFDDDVWRANALQLLAARARAESGPVVVVGRCHARDSNCQVVHPQWELNLANLYRDNSICNNAVLFSKHLVDLAGMYDCHIGMRRVCDWDLWQRLIKYARFVVTDEIVTDVFAHKADSVAMTMPYDLAVIRWFQSIPRDDLLTPARWRAYQVDALRLGNFELHGELRRRLYEDQILPYYLKFRHHFPTLEGFSNRVPGVPATILRTRTHFETTRDLVATTASLDHFSNQRGTFKSTYQSLVEIRPTWPDESDALLLIAETQPKANELTQIALRAEKPVGLLLDGDCSNPNGSARSAHAQTAPHFEPLFRDTLQQVDVLYPESNARAWAMLNPRQAIWRGCVARSDLPSTLQPHPVGTPIRIGCAISSESAKEFGFWWNALTRLAQEFKHAIEFVFLVSTQIKLPQLASPVTQVKYPASYATSAQWLRDLNLDMACLPAVDDSDAHQAVELAKYFQAAVAGALAIVSNVTQYHALPDALACLKSDNTAAAWYDVLRRAVTMPIEASYRIRRRAQEYVREEFTELPQIHLYEAALRAAEFHAKTRARRSSDGRPRVVYALHSAFYGGGELQLWRRIRLAQSYGIAPMIILPQRIAETSDAQRISANLLREGIPVDFLDYDCFVSPYSPTDYQNEAQCNAVQFYLEQARPALVHSVTFIPILGQVCATMNIPHIASLYAIDDTFAWSESQAHFKHCDIAQSDCLRYAQRWGQLLWAENFCAREVVPEPVFALGQKKFLEQVETPIRAVPARPHLVVTGTIQERKSQLEIIYAAGQLRKEDYDFELSIYGYTHFFPEYIRKCAQAIQEQNLEQCVRFCGFQDDAVEILRAADLVLSLSTVESFPSAIKEAMAAGVLVVATPVGGIAELIIDGVSGILCVDTSVEAMTDGIRRALKLTADDRARIVEQARRVARSEFHPYRAANDLLTMYNRALDLGRARQVSASPPNVPPAIAPQRSRMLAPDVSPASVVPLDRRLLYHVVPQHSQWIGLDVLVGTHQRPARGALHLRVYSPSAQLVRECSVDLAHAQDNEWLHFRFAPVLNFTERAARLEFVLRDPTATTRLSFYDANPPANKLGRIRARVARWLGLSQPMRSLYCRMLYAQ